jgi:cbb3-type cytochrome oxidase maturation protein
VTSLYLLIPVSLIFCALAIAIFFWAVNSGQYEDLDGEGERLLFSDDHLEEESGSISDEENTERKQTEELQEQVDSLNGGKGKLND